MIFERHALRTIADAGKPRSGPISLWLGFATEDYGYAIDLGLPTPGPGVSREEASLLGHDPVVNAEAVWVRERLSNQNAISRRGNASVLVQDGELTSV